jgi:pSer/pThr/pTyr-binding forkhead associated (FHA) protein
MNRNAVSRITLFLLAGIAAGFFTWLVSDGSGILRLSENNAALDVGELLKYRIIFLAWGGSIGVFLGLADILAAGQTGQWTRAVGFGLLVGLVSGLLGGSLGMAIYGMIAVPQAASPVDFLRNVLARAIGWGLIGAFAGTTAGWRKLSLRVGRNGFWGGLLGGLLGGTTFEIVPYLLPGVAVGGLVRFLGFVITGACIGLFVALVQELFKEAWVRVVVGRNEGKEILIEKAETQIGRSELSDIPLFGDPAIAKIHAVLVARPGGRFMLRDTSGSPTGVVLNGSRITGEASVTSGDQIGIAGRTLIFYERHARTPTVAAPRDVAPARPRAVEPFPGLAVTAAAPPRPIGREITAEGYLVATSGPYTGTVFPVRGGAVAGRDPAAEIPLPADTKASRAHARFTFANGAFQVDDCGSTNGTYVNGQRITRQPLVAGDTITIGTTAFRFE